MLRPSILALLAFLPFPVWTLRWAPEFVGYNLNENEEATEPTDYWGEWKNHTYHPSPSNWRFPFYVLTIDRYVDGDPTNNEANGTNFEHNWMTNQFRFGGDVKGLQFDLDYVQGMGIRGIYLTGSPFINMPWGGDGFGPLDFTLLDRHHGNIEDWRALITEIHRRDMYVILDNTMATMGNLMSMEGYLNASAEFSWQEHDYFWKGERRYHDFVPGNEHNASCKYPRMWGQDGYRIPPDITAQQNGCRDSEFDMYGDIKGTGAYPAWQSQLSNFASVQDRLREWRDDVFDKIKIMSCIQIAMLDLDGFRMDKALQTTPDKLAEFSAWQRKCGREHGKDNFLMVGEIVGDPKLAGIYVGRGKQPDQIVPNVTEALMATNATNSSAYVREFGMGGLDGAAFHYDIYGAMTRFLGLDSPWGAYGVDWVEHWSKLVSTNDMVNSETGVMDPRHMFGMTGQDVFRWPALANGTQRQLLGFFVTQLELPGIPMILYGEEQASYILENTADDYVFGRTPMASQRAWQLHGCYNLSETVYVDIPFNSSGYGCHDDSISLDHRDPSHPMRNVLKRMYELRRQFPTLNDGYNLLTLSSRTYDIYLPGSKGIPSPHGIWSVYRGRTEGVQDLAGVGQGNQGVWLLYQNENKTVDYRFDCASDDRSEALISAFPANTTVKNLFYPYEELTLEASTSAFGIEGSTEPNGCLSELTMAPWDYKAFVPIDAWLTPAPMITRVVPGHDARLHSSVPYNDQETVSIQIRFSSEMDCDSIADNMVIASSSVPNQDAQLNRSSVSCMLADADPPRHIGEIATAFIFNADLINVFNGIHTYTVNNATTKDGLLYTNAFDRFMFRIGHSDNPMVFPQSSNYTRSLLFKNESTDRLYISPKAAGADKFRYSTNWGSSFSQWSDFTSENITLEKQAWTGTKTQEWDGEHVVVHYWSSKAGSSEHVQHADLNRGNLPPRRWPHAFVEGSWNQWGYDNGLPNAMLLAPNGSWQFDLVAEWPTEFVVNVWGMNPDGYPDKTMAFGDVDRDFVLDWVPPDSLAKNTIHSPKELLREHLGYRLIVNDGNYNYAFRPLGHAWIQVLVAIPLALLPLAAGILCCVAFMKFFYKVKFNELGMTEKNDMLAFTRPILPDRDALQRSVANLFSDSKLELAAPDPGSFGGALAAETGSPDRRTVLIATMEYEIEDWDIKIKIGGLGVMASLMAKNLGHQDLIWVIPCIGDVDYPIDRVAQPMDVVVMGQMYRIEVQYHTLRNITFVLLDAPVFRKQTKAEPYPPRMDDLDSAIYYSAWNSCIAETYKRFPVDLYHINDYHGTLAPLHLLPRTIPVCLSLHNAEFQGLWPVRTAEEFDEICQVYDLDKDYVREYVQFGQVFNLLHAGASYLRKHQKGFGAVGVSKKYGKRSFARYPIFWGLSKVGSLPNPDPTDTGEWDKVLLSKEGVAIDSAVEEERGALRVAAQKWAGLNIDPSAELFVFVGRWSNQKGIDLVADVFFSILEQHPKAQLICVGPVIDLYGKFAAVKLAKMMEQYPGRVFSKPEFTALPPCIFSGAEFALIPSRDEPFGLVAVEFGRKGALGVGARVGGLGNMPGWWYTIESPATKHLLSQFKGAIHAALATKAETRAMMRARSRLQRFPVVQWVEDLEKLQNKSISLHNRVEAGRGRSTQRQPRSRRESPSISTAPGSTGLSSAFSTAPNTEPNSRSNSRPPSRAQSPSIHATMTGTQEQMSLGRLFGPSNPRSSSQARSRSSSRNRLGGKRTIMPTGTLDGVIANNRVSVVPEGNEDTGVAAPDSPRLHSISPEILPIDVEEESFGTDTANASFPPRFPPLAPPVIEFAPDASGASTPTAGHRRIPRSASSLSLNSVVGERKDMKLQKVHPLFTDSTEAYYRAFQEKLASVDSKTAEDQLCIEEFLVKSEKAWFTRFHHAQMGNSAAASRSATPASSVFKMLWDRAPNEISASESPPDTDFGTSEFLLGDDYQPPTGIKKFLQKKIGDWYLYTFLLAFGQIIAANSYQITLLTGAYGQAANKLYVVASIYLASSVIWWALFRLVKQAYVLSTPFVLYGLAFFLIGMGPYTSNLTSRGWIYNVATALYAVASASGSLFFALNFGTEGGTPAQSWAFRACVIQGSQQIFVAALWFWGSTLTASSNAGTLSSTALITSRPTITAITTPIAVLLWAVGLVLLLGLPNYYRQRPGKIPAFYQTLFRRDIVVWFFIAVVLQNYWLSAPYGRNWRYLWSSQHAPTWSIILLILIFFVAVWTAALAVLGHLSKQHSWIIPIFSIGLGCPRWSQILWAISGIATYIPHGSPAVGAALGRALWCWLAVLDAVQGVGFGIILLQTLTRYHVAFTLLFAQVVGSVATIAARASAPDATGPGRVFPNFGVEEGRGLRAWEFWVCLLCQVAVPVGFLVFFRKSQLFKP
ncbi:MAG: hypothetical protein LQ345_002108 [Seirophora villosa]|nr:MAG: hypothetical protein LQ345_002108 [Seirophora villosa]